MGLGSKSIVIAPFWFSTEHLATRNVGMGGGGGGELGLVGRGSIGKSDYNHLFTRLIKRGMVDEKTRWIYKSYSHPLHRTNYFCIPIHIYWSGVLDGGGVGLVRRIWQLSVCEPDEKGDD